jgi:hypothetical protein
MEAGVSTILSLRSLMSFVPERYVPTAATSRFSRGMMRFEVRRRDKSVNLRLPEPLLEAVRKEAAKTGVPYQRLIRMALERVVAASRS